MILYGDAEELWKCTKKLP